MPIGVSFNQLLGNALSAPTTAPPGSVFRVPFTWTSAYRRAAYGTPADTGVTLTPGLTRTIEMLINPNSIGVQMAKRIAVVERQAGKAFFHFTDKEERDNDLMVLTFRGNTGPLDLRGDVLRSGLDNTGSSAYLSLFHNLFHLTNEPKVFAGRYHNVVTLQMATAAIPVPVRFDGFFSAPLTFTMTADKPNSQIYDFQFTVTNMSPSLSGLLEAVTAVTSSADPTVAANSRIFITV